MNHIWHAYSILSSETKVNDLVTLRVTFMLKIAFLSVYILVCAYQSNKILLLQKYTHLRNAERTTQIHYTRDPLWWLGVGLMGVGELGNFSAYGFAPASLVAPLGTTTVIGRLLIFLIVSETSLRTDLHLHP